MRTPYLVAVLVGLLFFTSHAQEINHYVVVGAFGMKENAARLSTKISKSTFKARFSINASKSLYYVYLLETTNQEQAYSFLMRVRLETPYKDAWVFHGRLGSEPVVVVPVSKPEVAKPEVKKEEPAPPAIVVQEKPEEKSVETAVAPVADPVVPKPPGKPFYFKLVSELTGNPVSGEIHVLESSKADEYIAYESNKVVYLPAPKNRGGTYQVKTLAPGYKESKRSISYVDPANSAASVGPEKEFVIALPLIRVKAGDYIEFTNVRFFQNTVILQPESKAELGGLAALMKENPGYKMLIHGHCNGDDSRDITTLGSSTDYFATSTGNGRETADAKRFTLLRAETVKAYLVQQGIEESRIKTKGEGGKNFIYPKTSTLSARNDRIEVEVKKGK